MEGIKAIEAIAMIFAIGGSALMAKGQIEKGFISFLIGNVFLAFVAINAGLGALLLQTTLFSVSGMKSLFQINKKTALLTAISMVVLGGLIYLGVEFNVSALSLETTPVEVVAMVLAVSGNLFMSEDLNKQVNAFYLFVAADLLYLIVAINNSLWFFAIQTAVFLLLSLIGIRRARKEMDTEDIQKLEKIFKYES